MISIRSAVYELFWRMLRNRLFESLNKRES
jgi:hypothetical protein